MMKLKCIYKRIAADIKPFALVMVVLAVFYLYVHFIFDAFCPSLIILGIPCAGCGLTRAGLYLLQGDVARAFNVNPSVFPIVIFLIYCGFFRYVKGERIKGFSVIFTILILCMFAIYGYRMYLYFPDKPPYVYHRKNILSQLVPWYKDWMIQLISQVRAWRG